MRSLLPYALGLALVGATTASPPHARADLGIRAGFADGADDIYLGVELDTGARVGPARFAPSADLVIDDSNRLDLNGDLRWNLLPIPETGIMLYGKAGPTLVLAKDNELGVSLTVGGDIPMRRQRALQLELRFGFGDISDTKIGAAVLLPF